MERLAQPPIVNPPANSTSQPPAPPTPAAPKPVRRGLEPAWTVDDARELYQVRRWGGGFFDVNDAGHVVVRPHKTPQPEIDLYEVIQGLKERGLKTPVIVAFSDLLARRLTDLHQ